MIVTVPRSSGLYWLIKAELPGGPSLFRATARLLVALTVASAAGCSQAISPTVLQDAQIAVRVKTALVNDSVLGVRPIEVGVTRGIARLTGSVASEAEAQRAVQIVRSVAGVRDVLTELVVRATATDSVSPAVGGAPAAVSPDGVTEADVEEVNGPSLFAIGVGVRQSRPAAEGLHSSASVVPLIRLGSGTGLGVTLGFGWFAADMSSGSLPLARVRIRPVMAGVAYTLGADRLSTSFSLVGGVAFNSLSEQRRAVGPVWALDVGNSLVWRPGVSLWVDLEPANRVQPVRGLRDDNTRPLRAREWTGADAGAAR